MRRLVPFFCCIALAASLALAGEPITIGERVTIPSKVMGEERTLLISTPPDYARSQDRYPVLYMTDGDAHLTHTRGTVDFLVRNGLMPDVIIVGVTNTNRNRDLTPTHAFRVADDGTRTEIVDSGGAAKFLSFFAEELIPYVDEHYRTVPYRIFAGHSYGGLFSLCALATRPELFQAFIAASPSLNFDDEYPLRTLEAFFKDRKELRRTLFVTMANEEAGDPAPTRFDRLKKILGEVKAADFVWDSRLMADETHGTVPLRSHYWGLRKIYEGWALPAGPEGGGFRGTVDGLKNHFAALSKRFGYAIVPPENAVNAAGYGALGRNDVEGALAFFRYNVEIHPLAPNPYDSLGEALERAGKLEAAHASYAKAVENAVALSDNRLAIFTANRDRAAAKLKEQQAKP